MDFLQFMSWVATVVTIGYFTSGIFVCWQFKSSKSTGDIPVLPFLTSALNTLLWMSYGMLKIDYTIIYVNAVGLLLQCGYILVFYTYTFNRAKVKCQLLVTVLFGASTLAYIKYAFSMSEESALFQLGIICNIITVAMFGSPLTTVALVIQTKSTKSMSLPLSAGMALVGGAWLVYGILVGDLFIEVRLLTIVQSTLLLRCRTPVSPRFLMFVA
jgi:solute carrier family 50 protein (sugar transporter)